MAGERERSIPPPSAAVRAIVSEEKGPDAWIGRAHV